MAILLVLANSTLAAQGSQGAVPTARELADALKGIGSFRVQLSITAATVDTVVLRNQVELRLRQSGIRVDATAESYLEVMCLALDRDTDTAAGAIAYHCVLNVVQMVNRLAPTPLIVVGTTWTSNGMIGVTLRKTFQEKVEKAVDIQVTQFLNAWFKANPR